MSVTKQISNLDEAGVTLVELVIAVAILATAVFGSTRLINAASRTSNESGRRTQATILADREIELVRVLRDTNILTDPNENAWAGFPALNSSTGCVTFVVEGTADPDNKWQASAAITPGTHQAYTVAEKFFTEESDAMYSNYQRSILMCETTTPGLRRINVEVVWQEPTGPERSVVYDTYLGDWDLEE